MTEDEIKHFLRPKHHYGAIITLLIAVGGTVWAVTSWLHNRADTDDVKGLRNDSFQQRLDLEVVKGDVKTINVRIDDGFKTMNQRFDELSKQPRRR